MARGAPDWVKSTLQAPTRFYGGATSYANREQNIAANSIVGTPNEPIGAGKVWYITAIWFSCDKPGISQWVGLYQKNNKVLSMWFDTQGFMVFPIPLRISGGSSGSDLSFNYYNTDDTQTAIAVGFAYQEVSE